MTVSAHHNQTGALGELKELVQDLLPIEQYSSVENLLERIARSAKKILAADLVEFHTYNQNQSQFEPPQISIGKKLIKSDATDIYNNAIFLQMIRRQDPFYETPPKTSDILDRRSQQVNGNIDENQEPDVEYEKMQSKAFVPLRSHNEAVGVMFVYYYKPQTFDKTQRELIELFASQIAMAIKNKRQCTDFQNRLSDLTTLQMVVRKISNVVNLDEVLKDILKSAYNMLGFEYAIISLVDDAKQVIEAKHGMWQGKLDVFPEWIKMASYPLDHWDIEPDIVRSGKTEVISDWDDRFNKDIWEEFHHERLIRIFMPITVEGKRIGTLDVGYDKSVKQTITTEEQHSLQTFVDQVAIVIKNARLYEQLNNINRRQKSLVNFGSWLGSKIPQGETGIFDFINDFVHEQANQFFDIDNMYIAMYDKARDMVRFGLVLKYGRRIEMEPRKAGKGRTEEIVRTGKSIFISSRKESEEWYNLPGREEYLGDPLASWMGVPMTANKKVIGVIAVYNPTKDYIYTTKDLTLLQAMAHMAAIALENSRLYETAKQMRDEKVAAEQLTTLGTTIAALQHRINNTFNIIVLNVARLKQRVDLTDETVAEILDIIDRNARITSDLIGRIQEPLREVEDQTVNINAVLDEVLQKAQQKWHMDSVKVESQLDNDIPQIRAPIGQVTEVFSNLIDNAYRAMGNSGHLKVISHINKNKICIWVHDTGPGIPDVIQKRLFKKPVPSKDPGRHAGLGLWLSQLMLKRIGGQVKIESNDSTGTTMLVQISYSAAKED